MLHYKQLAVDLEKRIEKSRKSKYSPDCNGGDSAANGLLSTETASSFKDLSQISFSEDCNRAVLNLLDDSVQNVEENEMNSNNIQSHMNDLISFDESSDEGESVLNLSEGVLRTQNSEKSDTDKENRQRPRKKDKTRSLSLSFSRKSGRKRVGERQKRPKTTDLVSFRTSVLNNTIEEILKKFHESQMRKFSELIEKQQVEHINLLNQLEINQKNLIENLQKTLQNFHFEGSNVERSNGQSEKKVSTATIDAEPQINGGVSQHSNLDLDLSSFSRTLYVTTNSSINVAENDFPVITTSPSTVTVSPLTEIVKGSISNQIDRKYEACCKIQAFVRGFLVRRLMRTVRVQEKIKTIKDSIKCLDELYIEDKALLKEPDFLLGDRIIKQIETAICELNKIFFDLSISERLDIIRCDREILKQKEFKRMSQRPVGNRPFSASTVSSSKSFRSNRI